VVFFCLSDFRFIISFSGNIPPPNIEMLENTERARKKDNPVRLATLGTQGEEKTKQKRNTICVGQSYT
jgi:hypothetical protein